MNLVDVNVLIYAVNADSPHHQRAKQWLEVALSGVEAIGFTWTVLLAFLRVTTRHAMQKPLDITAAVAYVDSWLRQPNVQIVEPGEDHWLVLRSLLSTTGTGGNLTSDAHLAALAIGGGWTLVSTDHDFRRYAGLSFFNPLDA